MRRIELDDQLERVIREDPLARRVERAVEMPNTVDRALEYRPGCGAPDGARPHAECRFVPVDGHDVHEVDDSTRVRARLAELSLGAGRPGCA